MIIKTELELFFTLNLALPLAIRVFRWGIDGNQNQLVPVIATGSPVIPGAVQIRE